MPSRRGFLGAMVSVLGLTSVSWAASSGTSLVVPSSEGVTEDGNVADITGIDGELLEQRGKGGTTKAGEVLYEIEMADQASSDEIFIPIDFLNPYDMGKVLRNPNAYLHIGVWYEASGGYEVSGKDVSDGTEVKLDSTTEKRFSQSHASDVLIPTVDKDPLYIIAQIKTPGRAPPGQQKQTGEFNFNAKIRSQ